MSKTAFILLTFCFTSTAACGGVAEESEYLKRYRAIRVQAEEESKAVYSEIEKAYDPKESYAEQAKRLAPLRARVDAIYRAAIEHSLKIVAPHAADDAAVEPLAWIASKYLPREAAATATKLLAEHHLVQPETIALAKQLAIGPGGSRTEPLLRSLLASPQLPEEQRWKLQLALARFYQSKAEFVRHLSCSEDNVTPRLEAVYGPQYLATARSADAKQIDQQAIKEFKHLCDSSPNQVLKQGITVGEFATSAIFALENLCGGKPAPEIIGKNLSGELMKLSDFRGKVVLLSFWANWCSPCMAEIPNERRITNEYIGRPFAIVGVNADPDLARLPTVIEENQISWASFWDGAKGPISPITRARHITSWPTTYLLDHRGVIRGKSLQGPRLDAMIAELVGQAESPSANE